MKIDMISNALAIKTIAEVGGSESPQQQAEFARKGEGFPKKWIAKTSCSPGYVVPNCKEYKGPLPPDPRI